ncbi:hypothetical protein GY21_17895 [Cryobacterium roopkundense]|uniref:Uncharacterized protein YeaC (DUF1315 family) n=1 Tax=Cryobacterium roopkundense TaxID=1001240 RepID=A0A099J1P0_9MICO|nr:hypothetical protein [Cryobacterium roopkundense]KGJ72070.1 hypothetical protein GY21_17895 [Cryobacterium roopkundense]MBB5643543.1 uncharacterized protein YeaC (DUF1315 family) [Cryobacterium roopkundense]
MPNTTWRDEWPPFRVKLIDETARCFANQQVAVTNGQQPDWVSLTSEQQENLTENIAHIFRAQAQAMDNLVKRGLVP